MSNRGLDDQEGHLLSYDVDVVAGWCVAAMLRSKARPKMMCWFKAKEGIFVPFDDGDPDSDWVAVVLTRQCIMRGADRDYVFSHVLIMPERHNLWPTLSQRRFLELLHT